MAYKRRSSTSRFYKKPLYIWVTGLILAALLLGGIYFVFVKDNSASTADASAEATRQKQALADANAQDKQQLVENNDQPKTSDQNSSTTASIESSSSVITELTARQETNGSVTVIAKLNPSATGKCNLLATNGAKTNSQSVDTIYQPEFSTCAGFSIPSSALGPGSWTIKLTVGSSVKSTSLEVN